VSFDASREPSLHKREAEREREQLQERERLEVDSYAFAGL